MNRKKNRRKTWLEKHYGFSKIPGNIGQKKLEKLVVHALRKRQKKVLDYIVVIYPDFVFPYEMDMATIIYNEYPGYLRDAFELGIKPDIGGPFMCLVHDDPYYSEMGIRYGANPAMPNSEGEVALGFATAHQNLDVIKVILNSGADINIVEHFSNGEKGTALDCAYNNQEIYDFLKSKGAKHYKELKNAEE